MANPKPRATGSSPLEHPLRIITTPATKYSGEVGFSVRLSSDPSHIGRLPVVGDTYSESKVSTVRMSEFKDYICTDIQGSGDYIDVCFSKNKTAAQLLEPYRTRRKRTGNHYWAPQLLDVEITLSKFPRAINIGNVTVRGNSYTATPVWIPSMDTGSLFIYRYYLSPEEFDIPEADTPKLGAVSFPVPGQGQFTFGECYHRELVIPEMMDAVTNYDNVGAGISNNLGLVGERTFKATDPAFWLPYFMFDDQDAIATGAFLRTVIEVVPPNLPVRIRGR